MGKKNPVRTRRRSLTKFRGGTAEGVKKSKKKKKTEHALWGGR